MSNSNNTPQYHTLKSGDVIQRGDEVQIGVNWEPRSPDEWGKVYDNGWLPTRRKVVNPEPLPLAQRVTQGPVTATRYTGPDDSWRVGGEFPHRVCGGSNKVSGADAELIAEAFNVAHETGLTPRQLWTRAQQFITALDDLLKQQNERDQYGPLVRAQKNALELLQSLTK